MANANDAFLVSNPIKPEYLSCFNDAVVFVQPKGKARDAFSIIQDEQLKYLSRISSAVLIGGLDYECRDHFNYEKNTARMPYQYGVPSQRELDRWCSNQTFHPSFQISNAVLTHLVVTQ